MITDCQSVQFLVILFQASVQIDSGSDETLFPHITDHSSENLEASSSVSDGDSESCSDSEFSDNDEDHDDDL